MSRRPKNRRRSRQGSAPRGNRAQRSASTATARYPDRTKARMALAPGILLAVILLAGLALVGTEEYVFVLYAVAILAAVMSWFSIQARAWWWLIGLGPMVVLWNPILPFAFLEVVWSSLHLVGIGVAVAAGLIIRTPVSD